MLAQGRGVYPLETRAHSQTKSMPEPTISINGGSPKRPASPRPDNSDNTTDDKPGSIYLESES